MNKQEKEEMKEGCGVLFKNGSGIIICGEKRVDGNCFLCKRCLKNDLMELKDLINTQAFIIKILEKEQVIRRELKGFKPRRPKKTRVPFWSSKPSKYIKKRKKK